MKEYVASTTIDASAERVWRILTSPEDYPKFDPYCDRIEGLIVEGEKLRAYSKLSPGRAFPVRVTEMTPGEHMTWTGGMPLGLFKGVRTFELDGDGPVRFTLREVFSGPMLALIGRSIPDMTEPFERFCEGLKARAESPDQ